MSRRSSSASRFCRREKNASDLKTENVSGNKFHGPIQTLVSVTKGDRKHTKRKKRDHFPPLSGNEISAAGCLRLLPKHGRCESLNASQLVAANKLLLCDKMFAGLMGLECHTKPLTHCSEGKHGSLYSLFRLTCDVNTSSRGNTTGLHINVYFFTSINICVSACFWSMLAES